jgi:nitrogen fixation NifU-like protein
VLLLRLSIRFKEKEKPPASRFALQESSHYTNESMFNDIVLEHFRNPHNAGELPDATATVDVSNPVCGDVLRLSVRVEEGRIVAARFKTQGCVASIASSSILTDLLTGASLAAATEITPQQISAALGGLPPATFHAAQLCADALAALRRNLSPK